MEKIVCFPQIVQIIITPTPFALLWSVSEKVCLKKTHGLLFSSFWRTCRHKNNEFSKQTQRWFQQSEKLTPNDICAKLSSKSVIWKKRYSCCVLSLLFWELNSLFRLCFKRNVLLLNKKSIFIYLVRRFAINGQKSDFQRSRFSDFFFTFGLLHFYSANIRYNNSRNNNAFPFFYAKRMQRLFPTRYKHK